MGRITGWKTSAVISITLQALPSNKIFMLYNGVFFIDIKQATGAGEKAEENEKDVSNRKG